jgi:hypothetical protein
MKQFISGQYISQGYYKSFQPEFINRQLQIDNMGNIAIVKPS